MDKLRVRLVLRLGNGETRDIEPAFLHPLTIPARLRWIEIERTDSVGQDQRDV